MRKHSLSTLLFICICEMAVAQLPQLTFTFEHITPQDGLAHRVVNDVMQDHKGYIWMATQNGLQRYDGQRFMNWHKSFGNAYSLPSDNVSHIFEDHANNIWVVCHNGVAILNTSNYLLHRVPVDLDRSYTDLNVYNIFEDSRNNIWMMTKEAGILHFNPATKHFEKASSFFPKHRWKFLSLIEEPVTGNYWLTSDSGIAYADMRQKAIYDHLNNPDEHPVLSNPKFYGHPILNLFIDSYLKLWITGFRSDGLGLKSDFEVDRYNLFLKRFENTTQIPTGNYHYVQDKAGNIWLSGAGDLHVWRPETGRFYQINKKNPMGMGFDADIATDLCEDNEQNIWVATTNGVYVFNPLSQQIHIQRLNKPGMAENDGANFNQFVELPDGRVWAATWGHGIVEYDNMLVQQRIIMPSAGKNDPNYDMIWNFHLTRDSSTIWIACQLGRVMAYDIRTGRFTHYNDAAFDLRTVRSITEDGKGDLWFGTQHGLVVRRDKASGRFIRYVDDQYPAKENLGNIMKVMFDNEGRMWLNTQYSGLVEMDPATGKLLRTYRSKDDDELTGLSGNSCHDMIQYDADNLWIATPMGINIFNKRKERFDHINTKDGLLSNLVYSLLKDRSGFVWAGTADGFYKIAWPSKKMVRFGKKDGILNDGFQIGGLKMLRDGRLLSATSKDFAWFYPDSLISRKATPKVELTWVKVQGKEVNIDSVLLGSRPLELDHDQNFITIEFAALSFLNRGRLTYYCRLDGLEENWNKTNDQLFSSYSNLKPGTYTYMVYAENSEGNRGPVTSFKIRVLPPWWNAWWFYVICFLLFLGLLYLLHRIRVNRILAMEKVRNRIARDLHDDMGSTLSTINILSEMAKRKVQTDTEKTSEYINKISDNSQRMMEAMDDIVWSINPTNDSMGRIVARMREYATNILEAKDIEFKFRADDSINDVKIGLESRRDLFLIFKEAVNNLAKYSQCKHAHIAIRIHKKHLVMIVEDDGIGFDTSTADSGNGLTNMKKRAELLKGRYDIRSVPGKGTRVLLEIPV